MSRPTARVLLLLEILESGGTHRVGRLAERLGVDERTVRRYVERLTELDVPVESLRGRYGGYRLAPGFRMPPLMLTDDEALAVLLGLMTIRGGAVTAGSATAADNAAAKVLRVLPTSLAARFDVLLDTAEFTDRTRAVLTPQAQVLLELAEAVRQQHAAEITYVDRADRRSMRTVQPFGLVAHSGRWYLAGVDSASGESRTFRVDRIRGVRATNMSLAVPQHGGAAAEVLASLARTPWRHHVVAYVSGDIEDVRRRLPLGLATMVPAAGSSDDVLDREWVRVELRAESLHWVPSLFLGLGLPFLVTQPPELVDLVRAWATAVVRSTSAATPSAAVIAWDGVRTGSDTTSAAAANFDIAEFRSVT